jgi:hypothetical protein
MNEYVGVNVKYIQCDASGCDYITHDGVSNDTLVNWLNRPCPDCGENLLTDADYKEFDNHLKLAKFFNAVVDKVAPMSEEELTGQEKVVFAELETDGAGNTVARKSTN